MVTSISKRLHTDLYQLVPPGTDRDMYMDDDMDDDMVRVGSYTITHLITQPHTETSMALYRCSLTPGQGG